MGSEMCIRDSACPRSAAPPTLSKLQSRSPRTPSLCAPPPRHPTHAVAPPSYLPIPSSKKGGASTNDEIRTAAEAKLLEEMEAELGTPPSIYDTLLFSIGSIARYIYNVSTHRRSHARRLDCAASPVMSPSTGCHRGARNCHSSRARPLLVRLVSSA